MSTTPTYSIIGNDLQAIELTLEAGMSVRSEAGMMLYAEDEIIMQTNAEGGLLKGVKRMMTGESFFITTFTNQSQTSGKIGFAAPYPGTIMAVNLAEFGGVYYCQRDSFLCATGNVDIDIAFTKKLRAGMFGGEGFILQKISGDGLAFVHIGGTLITKELKAGETLRVDTGCLAGFTEGVQYDIQFVGGITNTLFGGEGLFYAHLTGPGKVYLQSLPFSRIAERLQAAASGKPSAAGEVNRVGGIIGDFLGGK